MKFSIVFWKFSFIFRILWSVPNSLSMVRNGEIGTQYFCTCDLTALTSDWISCWNQFFLWWYLGPRPPGCWAPSALGTILISAHGCWQMNLRRMNFRMSLSCCSKNLTYFLYPLSINWSSGFISPSDFHSWKQQNHWCHPHFSCMKFG